VDGHTLLGLKINRSSLNESFTFKFISSNGNWYSPDDDSPNCRISGIGTSDFVFNPSITGRNVMQYHLHHGISMSDRLTAKFSNNATLAVNFTQWILSLHSDIPLGAMIVQDFTVFRIFAPRAISVRVAVFDIPQKCPQYYQLEPYVEGTWQVEVYKNLHGCYYYYQFLFGKGDSWATAPMVLDPYAKATLSSKGPGIVLAGKCFNGLRDKFLTPPAKDLVILEIHLRDLMAKAPVLVSSENRYTFAGLKKYLEKKKCYLRQLGINCVELQPILEFDYANRNEYHWGYMPVNWFSPSSSYAKNPAEASQVEDFKKLVRTFHDAGIAVILDVVYNHFGDAGHLQNIDSAYYFRHGKNGEYTNFSGCGNDVRTESPMVRKLIGDSLEHLLRTYNVDGFRFDLAELLGTRFLKILQKRLKNAKKSVVLIAEPWSFRNNIGIAIKKSSYSIWNDEYREFIKSYVTGNGNSEGLRYFLCGGLDFRSTFPCQSVNYIASHDDRGWVDSITENPHNNGSAPTSNDRRRTRLSAAILLMSIGIPMLASGQDFLFSKHGMNNTYNRGDLNFLDYRLLKTNADVHKYFRKFIEFRLSERGKVLRLAAVPQKTYFRFFPSATNSACAMAYNANGELKVDMLIFAINPHSAETTIDFMNLNLNDCKILADENKFFTFQKKFYDKFIGNKLFLPPMSCRLYAMK
jgi:pullulanase/glycogen debranching enzyme